MKIFIEEIWNSNTTALKQSQSITLSIWHHIASVGSNPRTEFGQPFSAWFSLGQPEVGHFRKEPIVADHNSLKFWPKWPLWAKPLLRNKERVFRKNSLSSESYGDLSGGIGRADWNPVCSQDRRNIVEQKWPVDSSRAAGISAIWDPPRNPAQLSVNWSEFRLAPTLSCRELTGGPHGRKNMELMPERTHWDVWTYLNMFSLSCFSGDFFTAFQDNRRISTVNYSLCV
jgi:hypothetical protein